MAYAARFEPNVIDSFAGELMLVITNPRAASDVTVKIMELDRFRGPGGARQDEGSESDLLATFTGAIADHKFTPSGPPTLPGGAGAGPLRLKFEGSGTVYQIPIVGEAGEDEGANFEIGVVIEKGGSAKFTSESPAYVRGGSTRHRVTLGVGDIAALCGDLGADAGKKKALQLLDLYPVPIGSREDTAAVLTAATEYAPRALSGGPDIGPLDADTLRACLPYLVQKAPRAPHGALPGDVQHDLTADPPRATGDTYFIFPGTYCFTDDDDLGAPLDDDRAAREKKFYDANSALGAFPLTIKVETMGVRGYEPAANAEVQVQLVDPFPDLDKNSEMDRRVSGYPNAADPPPAGGLDIPAAATWSTAQDGPRGYARARLDMSYDAADPQGVNIFQSRGGKRGLAVLENVFKRAPGGPELSAGRDHAVKGTTDAAGELKILFRPSRVAGDSYRIRAFVDPWDGAPCDGTQPTHPRGQTGVLTVYKTIRLSGVIAKPMPARLSRWYHHDALGTTGVLADEQTLGSIDWSRVKGDLLGAHLLLYEDSMVRIFNADRYRAALDFVRANIRTYLSGKNYDMNALLPVERHFPSNDANRIESLLTAGVQVTLTGSRARDTGDVVVDGLNAAGAALSETVRLNGTTAVNTTRAFARITRTAPSAGAPKYRVAAGASNVDVEGTLPTFPRKFEVRSSDRGDKMAVEIIGWTGLDLLRREVVKLNGTTKVRTRLEYKALCAARVAPVDGASNAGTVSIAPQGMEHWPTQSFAAGAGAVNLTAVSVFDSPHTFEMEYPLDYNALRAHGKTGFPTNTAGWWDFHEAAGKLCDALGAFFSQSGAVPGITVHRALGGDPVSRRRHTKRPYQLEGDGSDGHPALPGDWSSPTTSGVATRFRACLVWFSDELYNAAFAYDLTSNTQHEMGHVLFLRHGWTLRNAGVARYQKNNEGASFPPDHDYHDICVMAYHPSNGDYCGRCLLKLAGVKVAAIPANHS